MQVSDLHYEKATYKIIAQNDYFGDSYSKSAIKQYIEKRRKYVTELLEGELQVQEKIKLLVFHFYPYGKLGGRILEGVVLVTTANGTGKVEVRSHQKDLTNCTLYNLPLKDTQNATVDIFMVGCCLH